MKVRPNDCWSPEVHQGILDKVSTNLWRYIQKNAAAAEAEDLCAEITNLSKRDLKLLTAVHFLLEPEVEYFVSKSAPKILNNLSKSSTRERTICRGAVRGRIDTAETLRIQTASGGDPSLFVTWNRSTNFDLPENRLLKYILIKTAELSRGVAGEPVESQDISPKVFRKWSEHVQRVGGTASRLLKNVYLKQTTNLYELSHEVVERAEKARQCWYKDLASVSKLYIHAFHSNSAYLRKVLRKRYFEPLDWDVLYELYVLLEVFKAAESCGWTAVRTSLIGGTSRTAAVYKRGKVKLNVYYQHLPEDMARVSRYGSIMEEYGFGLSLRRPDIILERVKGEEKQYCIVEVKRSTDKNYLIEGVYKLMGYLKDFEDCMGSCKGTKGVLVGWLGIQKVPNFADLENEIVIADSSTVSAVLNRICILNK